MTPVGLQLRNADAHVWRTATWASPFVIQAILGVAVGVSWAAGRVFPQLHGFGQLALGAGVTLLLAGGVSAALLARRSVRAQGFAVSIVGTLAVAVVGATVYGLWIIGW